MGNNHSREGSPKYGISRNNSGVDLHDKVPSQLLPIDKLSKLLTQKTLEEDSIENGVSVGTFVRYLFPKYPELGQRLFGCWQHAAGVSPSSVLSAAMFKAQVDKLMTVMTDEQQIQMYVTMYAENTEYMNTEQFHSLLLTVYKISMDHYPDGPQSCRQLFKTLQAIINSAFHKKDSLPVVYLSHWLEEHCKRLVTVLHRFVVHILTTGFHSVTERLEDKDQGLELTTPVLEKAPAPWDKPQPLLPVSQVWILACTLPPLYTKPQHHSPATSSNNGFCTKTYLARMLDLSCPSHWTMLYSSLQHGLGTNRFLHHVLSYRGPTLTFLRGEQDTEFCIGVTQEWQESHLYWGGDDSIIVQILPLYHVVQRGPKLLYLNTKIRGYPKGIRAGLDPRKPSIDINESFTYVTYKGIPYQLQSIEVWGCGTPQSREMQLDIKKWEVKQAERQRVVKLSANEWSDHPDRYLLELAGRPNYSQSNN